MTPRERTLALLSGAPLDQVPWNGDLDYWMTYLRTEKLMKPEHAGEEGRFRLHKDLGVGFYLQGHFPFRTRFEGFTVRGENYEDGSYRNIWETPVGTLTEFYKYSPITYSHAPAEFLCKTAEDFKILKYIYEHTIYEPYFEFTNFVREHVGDQGVTLVYTPHTPFMTLVANQMGIENLVYAIDDDIDAFEELMDVMKKKFDEAVDIACASPAECIMVPENLSSESVGKKFYNKYMAPVHREWTDKIRAAGKYSFVHMDGTCRGLIKELSYSGFDVIEACTPSPVGDMTLTEMREVACPKSIIWGGIPGGYFTDLVSDEDFDQYVIGVLEIMRKDRRFCLGVADQVVPGARWERIARVKELADKYGKYE